MSENSQDEDHNTRVEIQNLLKRINNDMEKLKVELTSIHNLIDEHSQFPLNIKTVNEKLLITAKEAGIFFEDVDEDEEHDLDAIEIEEIDEKEANVEVEEADGKASDSTVLNNNSSQTSQSTQETE